jgi:hypothetical protein
MSADPLDKAQQVRSALWKTPERVEQPAAGAAPGVARLHQSSRLQVSSAHRAAGGRGAGDTLDIPRAWDDAAAGERLARARGLLDRKIGHILVLCLTEPVWREKK